MKIVAGLDCGKEVLDAALFPKGDILHVGNDAAGWAQLTAWMAQHGVRLAGIEASGGYERGVRDALCAQGLTVRVLDPARIRYLAKAKGRRAKNDAIDAAVIAEFTATFPDAPTIAADAGREELAGLLKARSLLVEKRTDLRHAATLAPEAAAEALRTGAEHLARLIAELDGQIAGLVAAPDPARIIDALTTAPGIGVLTATTLVARLPELGHTSPTRIAALAGVAPFDDDSGKRHGGRHIAGGRADVRKTLYMAALVAAHRTKGVIADTYRRLVDAGKPKKVALVACMRKLLVRLNAMLAAGQTWKEQPAS